MPAKPLSHGFLEAVTVSVGFDDLLDVTLAINRPHFDTFVVVTTPEDAATQAVAHNHGAVCVAVPGFFEEGRFFNKGAALNQGFAHFRHPGWRACLDADIALPAGLRDVLFAHTDLNEECLYGMDRVDVIGRESLERIFALGPQYGPSCLVGPNIESPTAVRYIDPQHGYIPIGYFQLWHATRHRPYPQASLTAAQDDVAFAAEWSRRERQLLPTAFCYHVLTRAPVLGENWNGRRHQPRLI